MKAVLLDALGTLLDLDSPVPRLRAELRERHGIVVGEREAALAVKAEIDHYKANLHRGVDAAGLAEVRAECGAVVSRSLGLEEDVTEALLAAIVFTPFAEVPGVLRAWRAEGKRLVVASNWDISLHEALERSGLDALLDGAVSSAEAGSAKPLPEVFHRALDIAGVAPEEALHVGDDVLADVAGATAAGIEAVLLVREGPQPPGIRSVRSLAELA